MIERNSKKHKHTYFSMNEQNLLVLLKNTRMRASNLLKNSGYATNNYQMIILTLNKLCKKGYINKNYDSIYGRRKKDPFPHYSLTQKGYSTVILLEQVYKL